jgi:hypothetical protein
VDFGAFGFESTLILPATSYGRETLLADFRMAFGETHIWQELKPLDCEKR